VARQFSGKDPQRRERTTLRIIAGSFFALAVTAEPRALSWEPVRQTGRWIVLVSISVVIMPVLSWAQRRARRELGSANARGGLPADVAVHLSLGGGSGWIHAQRRIRMRIDCTNLC
jgi:hypothetical protein